MVLRNVFHRGLREQIVEPSKPIRRTRGETEENIDRRVLRYPFHLRRERNALWTRKMDERCGQRKKASSEIFLPVSISTCRIRFANRLSDGRISARSGNFIEIVYRVTPRIRTDVKNPCPINGELKTEPSRGGREDNSAWNGIKLFLGVLLLSDAILSPSRKKRGSRWNWVKSRKNYPRG